MVTQSPTVGASPWYPWPESWGRNSSSKVRETRSSSSPKRSEREQEMVQRVERGIHGLNRWLVKCREMLRNAEFTQPETVRACRPPLPGARWPSRR